VSEDDVAGLVGMLAELEARAGVPGQSGESRLARLDRFAAQVLAIELQEVERDQVRVMLHTAAAAHQFEHRKTSHHRLAVNHAGFDPR
jgi:hypothetical protein